MKNVREILDSKSIKVISTTPDAHIFDALEIMSKMEIGAILVMTGDRLVGIMSERDYARKVILKGLSSKDARVKDIMTPKVQFVKPDQTVEEVLSIMTERRMRHLPVMDGDNVIGLISIGDAVAEIISQQDFKIQQLENYIYGP